MGARYDKYNPISGGFRALLEADWPKADEGVPIGVGLNASGRVVQGAGNTGVVGVVVVDETPGTNPYKLAGDPVDVMTDGEIVDVEDLLAGTAYFAADADGALTDTGPAAGANDTRVGHTAEASRLIVRCAQVQG